MCLGLGRGFFVQVAVWPYVCLNIDLCGHRIVWLLVFVVMGVSDCGFLKLCFFLVDLSDLSDSEP